MTNILANWPAPSCVQAVTTTRAGGQSRPPYDSNNLALHVGDKEADVLANRAALKKNLHLPAAPIWLEQTHSTRCVVIEKDINRNADASVTRCKGIPLAIMTADCLPIVLCNHDGSEIAAIHAGWRGLVGGIIENTLIQMQSKPSSLLAWVGPGICHLCYEIGYDVEEAYTKRYPFTQVAFYNKGSKQHADLPKMAALILNALGVNEVFQASRCTVESENELYSYRRSAQTGRMATLIWINGTN